MGTVFIGYKNKGFWIPPSFIEVLSEYICEMFEFIGISTFSQSLQDIYGDCDSNRKGQSIGMVNILFDISITNEKNKATLVTVLEETKKLILSKGAELSIEVLEKFESRKTVDEDKSKWAFPIKTSSLITTIDIIVQMLNETWESDNYSVYYTGLPNTSNRDEI